jgi:broad specificity phosphatase PhoE
MKIVNIFCIRHGESTHNILFQKMGMKTFFDKNYYDTNLTLNGINQSIELGNKWDNKDKMDLVIVSPLSRTLQTAMNIFKDTNVKIVALESVREYPNSLHTCNKRKDINTLKKLFPRVDFSNIKDNIDPSWNEHIGETIENLLQRINSLYDFIDSNDYNNIALVGHNSYISMVKDQRLNRTEDGMEELKHCFPYKIELKYN